MAAPPPDLGNERASNILSILVIGAEHTTTWGVHLIALLPSPAPRVLVQ
jgi:hypothetical protein